MISIENLSHTIDGTQILHDVTLQIPKGGITAIIGPNGAGKSTLFGLIARLMALQTGRIEIDGLDIAKVPSRELALKLAIQAQHVGVASRLCVADLVAFGRWPHHHGQSTPKDDIAVEEALHAFDLTDFKSRFLDTLSGGQQQRAFVAMAYAQATDWLLLDEPLNNLDLHYAQNLMQRLHSLTQPEHGHARSVVVVVHEINYAAAWADHVIALKDGQIAAQGNVQEVLREEILSDLYRMPMRILEDNGRPFVLHHA